MNTSRRPSFLSRCGSSTLHLNQRPGNRRQLRFESLEDRRLLAALTVSSLDDTLDGGSLREAINVANGNGEADTIEFSLSGTINLGSQLPTITTDMNIVGPGAELLTIDAGNGTDGLFATGDGFRIFSIDSLTPIQVEISDLTLTGGDIGTPISGSTAGGAILNHENLLLDRVNLVANAASSVGGGIRNVGDLVVRQSTFSGNTALTGGGLSNLSLTSSVGTATIVDSTLSGNSATGTVVFAGGGGIYNNSSAAVTITGSTLSGNSATTRGGGIFNRGTATLTGSIVANSTANEEVDSTLGTLTGSHNLVEDGSDGLADTITGDPLLGPLANNGGPTQTHALLPDSPAIDAIALTAPVHSYELNGTYADSFGGPDLVPLGGTLVGSGYEFENNEGLTLLSASNDPGEYTIELEFSYVAYDQGNPYQKIIDFKDRGSDNGLYALNDTLVFYESGQVAVSGSVFTANTLHNLVFSRDAVTDEIAAYVDGTLLWTYVDSSDQSVFSGPDQIMRFFENESGPSESEAGFVERIRIFDEVLSPEEVALLGTSFDQRGAPYAREVGAGRDVGAYEAQVAPSADFDNDLKVDGFDFLTWQIGFGMADASRADGNADDDTDVDASDLAAWQLTYGQDFNGPTGTAGGCQAHNNVQASLGLNYLIATQGTFPSGAFAPNGVPYIGEVALFAGDFEPNGWKFADGEILPISQHQALFSLLGTTYGGDGETTFGLPDLRGRTAMGEGTGPGLTPRSLGQKLGTETVTLTTSQLPTHSHSAIGGTVDTTQVGNGAAHNNVQPSLGLNYVITAQGSFPSQSGGGAFHNGYYGAISVYAGFEYATDGPHLNGQLVPTSQNSALFSLLGTTYGGDGRTTFALPDLRGRIAVHEGNGNNLGSRAGVETVALATNQMPAHTHTSPGPDDFTGSTGSGQAHENRQPYLTVNYVINLQGDFPSESGGFGTSSLGAIVPFAGNFAPQGSAFLDGQLLSIAQHQSLFSLLGTTYGGDGEITFALPDLRGRTPVGFGQGAGLTNRSLGEEFGASTHTLTQSQIPIHQHALDGSSAAVALAPTLTLLPSSTSTNLSLAYSPLLADALFGEDADATEEQLAVQPPTAEAIHTAGGETDKRSSTTFDFAELDAVGSGLEGDEAQQEPWLADELLERVFG
ncbi:tail fiber protein [Adhaeretor mobilis]|uniref:Phage Tail Collar Domain protein n=1 Tax=Adhaeretor mobilis TaxID=1930276 RepID=A0A517N136_9BACT|nr:tail fiber protein [Adhaeretor mobilis]QDT00843.1 Phage Tail Collar Domain protein [Adhaeretor mobilis]